MKKLLTICLVVGLIIIITGIVHASISLSDGTVTADRPAWGDWFGESVTTLTIDAHNVPGVKVSGKITGISNTDTSWVEIGLIQKVAWDYWQTAFGGGFESSVFDKGIYVVHWEEPTGIGLQLKEGWWVGSSTIHLEGGFAWDLAAPMTGSPWDFTISMYPTSSGYAYLTVEGEEIFGTQPLAYSGDHGYGDFSECYLIAQIWSTTENATFSFTDVQVEVLPALDLSYTLAPGNLADGPTFDNGQGGVPFGYDPGMPPPIGSWQAGPSGFGDSCFWSDVQGSTAGGGRDYTALRLSPKDIFGRSDVTVGELANISYYTKNMDTDLIDWQVKVYTESDVKWYGYRINYNRPDNPDNEWYQSSTADLGISDIYDKVAGASVPTSTDLDAEKILFIDIIAGYATDSPAVDSYLDGVQIELTNGDVATLDLAATATTVWVDDDYCDGCANDGHTWGYDAFDNIQDGIDAVGDSTVNVAAGTYEEQLSITTDLTLTGAGQGNTIITSPTTLDVMFTTASGSNPDRRPIVYVGSDATVTIQDLTVDGLGRGDANSQFMGISFFNAGGAVDNVHITRVRNGGLAGPLTGAQHGVSLTAFNDDGSPRSVNMTDCTIDDIQKNAVSLFGPALSVNVSDNVITGVGATTITAQNGIQLGSGAAGTISGNTITGIGYTGASWAATSILLFGGTGTTVSGNTITMSGSNGGDFGLNAQGGADNLTVSGNTFDGVAYGVIVLDGSGLVVTGNDMVNIYYEGIFLYGPVSGATITNNSITGAGDAAFFVWDSDGSGTFATHTIEHNEFSGSAWANAGVIDAAWAAPPAMGTLDLSANYWGSNDSAGVAATIYGTSAIDFSPILDNGDTDAGAVGFVPDLTVVTVHQEGAQVSSLIQEGMDTVVGSTVNVAAGTYDETVAIGTDFNGGTITGELGSMPLVTAGMTLADGLTGVTVENLHFTGVGASNTIIRMLGGVSGLTLDNCIIDGELTSGRHGFGGGQLEGDATITNCEFKDVLGWSLFESRSGSGGGGSPLDTIVFSNNNIHNCNGSVVFRGDETNPPTSYTDSVTISGNTWQTIGGNGSEQGQHWAAFEVNRAKDVNVFSNSVDNVSEGEWGEGQAAQLWSITDLDVHSNSFTNCFEGIKIFYIDDETAGSINYNTISGNTQYGLLVQAGATVGPLDAKYNYWGATSGPYDPDGVNETNGTICYDPANMKNADGMGDDVSNLNVDYCPWLISAFSDEDFDGVLDGIDNCHDTPNGPVFGTCVSGDIGDNCIANFHCGLIGGFCSMSQEDNDQDGLGDVCDDDIDGDGYLNDEDICPTDYDQGQEDTYPPPSGNICGDACECEGNFDNDLDVDGTDTTVFLDDIGRFSSNNPCTVLDPCNGDFDCDGDVDGTDTTKFLEDIGRFLYNKPCPQDCQTGDWCVYTP